MRIVVHDYSGHPGQVSLSRGLARRGHEVLHQYCSSYTTGRGAVDRQPDDPATFSVEALSLGRSFERYSTMRRVWQEIRYGRLATRAIRRAQPDVAILSNVPLLSLTVLVLALRSAGVPFVFWQQDVYSAAISAAAEQRLGRRTAGPIGWLAMSLERLAARLSIAVVPIDPSFVPVLRRWQIPEDRIHPVANWAPIEELPMASRDNAWATSKDLVEPPVVLYAGTLGLKHDPTLLSDAAHAMRDVRFVVVTEGLGRTILEAEKVAKQLDNLLLFNFQPYDAVPQMHATADILLAILEPDASRYSVPSKVLTYLCAGRPLVTVMLSDNSAARIVRSTDSGLVVAPGDHAGLIAALQQLAGSPDTRERMGRNARKYAEENFDAEHVAKTFEGLLEQHLDGAVHDPARSS